MFRVYDRQTDGYVGRGRWASHRVTDDKARIFATKAGIALSLGDYITLDPIYDNVPGVMRRRTNPFSKRILNTKRYRVEQLKGGSWGDPDV